MGRYKGRGEMTFSPAGVATLSAGRQGTGQRAYVFPFGLWPDGEFRIVPEDAAAAACLSISRCLIA